MGAKGPRRKWLSQSAHPKEAVRKYPGKRYDRLSDRDGNPTHRNSRDSTCGRCGGNVPAETGWPPILPRGAGNRGTAHAVMCQTCATPKRD